MVERKKEEDEEKPLMPELEGTSGKDAFYRLYDLHLDEDGNPIPVLEREKRLTKHRKDVVEITLDDVINGKVNLNHVTDDSKKRDAAAKIVNKLVKEGYRTYLKLPKKPETPQEIEEYLKIAGLDVDYNKLLDEISKKPNLTYEALDANSHLKKLIDHVAGTRDDEVMEVEKLQRYIASKDEIHDDVKKAAGEKMEVKFEPHETVREVFDVFKRHLDKKQAEYHEKYAREKPGETA